MKKILIIEDEKNIARFMKLELIHEGFEVDVCYSGREGLEVALKKQYDCILLDVMLPELNGIEVCRRIRSSSQVPVMLITARDAIMDRVAGLDAGADDYIVKPFAIEELLARIRSILRRVEGELTPSYKLVVKTVSLDADAYEVLCNGHKVDLTKTEYELLKFLMLHKNKVCPREQIIEQVWGFDSAIETNVVDVYIRHLRSKLKSDEPLIETVRGVGYVMRE